MNLMDQKISVWGGAFCIIALGGGLLLAGFVPPPSPLLGPAQIAALYHARSGAIAAGMVIGMFGTTGYLSLIGVISVQLLRIQGISRLAPYLQLGAGAICVLTLLFPFILFATAAFRPDRDPALIQLLNDVGWLISEASVPPFLAQLGAIAFAILQDKSAAPVFPRWSGYFNIVIAVMFISSTFSVCTQTGPFAWNGVLSFWVAGMPLFLWMLVMTWLTLRAIRQQESRVVLQTEPGGRMHAA